MDDLYLLVNLYLPHCICIVESWLGDDIQDMEIHLPGYNVYCLTGSDTVVELSIPLYCGGTAVRPS